MTPTVVLTSDKGNIVTKLFGEVSPERQADEQRMCNYRAEQLEPQKRRMESVREPFIFRDEFRNERPSDRTPRETGSPFE